VRDPIPQRGENEVFWYRRFYWNLHIVWTLTLVFLYSIATVTLIARAEFALPWWTSVSQRRDETRMHTRACVCVWRCVCACCD